jgi:hypothetical protein
MTQATFLTFNTAAADRVSKAVLPVALHWDDTTRTIRVVCSDKSIRECRVDRLSTVAEGRSLWKSIKTAVELKEEIHFVAAGGFDPTRWFYTIKFA